MHNIIRARIINSPWTKSALIFEISRKRNIGTSEGEVRVCISQEIYYLLWVAPKRLSNAFYPIKSVKVGGVQVREVERASRLQTAVNRRMQSPLEFGAEFPGSFRGRRQ